MKYKPDKLRIEDALLPALMLSIMRTRDIVMKEEESPFLGVYPILNQVINDNINTHKLRKRLQRIIDLCIDYLENDKFRTSKAFVTITIWGLILYRKDAVYVEKDSDLYRIWKDFYFTIRDDGIKHIDGFQKIYDSAVNHIAKIHKVVTNEGYYI